MLYNQKQDVSTSSLDLIMVSAKKGKKMASHSINKGWNIIEYKYLNANLQGERKKVKVNI